MKNKFFASALVLSLLLTAKSVYAVGVYDSLNSFNKTLNNINSTVNNTQRPVKNMENTISPKSDYTNNSNKGNSMQNRTVEKIPGTGYSKVCENGKCGLIENYNEQLVVSVKYDDVQYIGEETFKILKDGKFALYNTIRHKGSEFIYDDAEFLISQNVIKVKSNNKYGIVDGLNMREALPVNYDKIELLNITERSYKIVENGQAGVFAILSSDSLGTSGKELIKPSFKDVAYATNRFYKVFNGNKWAGYNHKTQTLATGFEYNCDDLKYDGWYWQVRKSANSEWVKLK